MSLEKQICKEYQEMFPLAHNRVLEESRLAEMREHLTECPACRSIEKRERALYLLATSKQSEQILTDQIDADLMDMYARDPGSMAPEQRQAIEEYLESHADAGQDIDLLRKLPHTLDALMEGQPLPSIERLEATISTPMTDIRPTAWRTWSAFAAAAVAVLVVVSQFGFRDEPRMAQIEAVFPAMTRSLQTLEFHTEDSPALVNAKLYVDPEEGHFYATEVYSSLNDSLVFQSGRIESFDDLGFAEFQATLARGQYLLKLYDVIDEDTLTTEQAFRLVP